MCTLLNAVVRWLRNIALELRPDIVVVIALGIVLLDRYGFHPLAHFARSSAWCAASVAIMILAEDGHLF